jgi:EF hand
MQSDPMDEEGGPRTTGQGGMMGHGMAGRHMMMGHGMMGPPPAMMRIMFALMDADGDGTISLQEFQAAHERIFKGMDTNRDGKLTPEEMKAFIYGSK